MTEIEKLKEQLHQQQKMASIGMLTAGIAHEIQNPLNFVINFSKMSGKLLSDLMSIIEDSVDRLEKEDAEEMQEIAEDLKENLKKIEEHGERAIDIIRSILLQSRGKEGEFLPTDVANLVHEYVWLSYHAMRASNKDFNISINEKYEEQMPKMMVIPQDFSRAVLNLMNNACYTVEERAMQEQSGYTPTINVDVHREGEELVVSIADNGMGMTQEVQNGLYEAFFTTKPIGKGTGLGMPITREIVQERHGGQLSFTSKEGEGTTFTIRIPIRLK